MTKKVYTGVFFYTGFSRPKKVANSVADLMKLIKQGEFTLTDNYLGEVTRDLLEAEQDELIDYDLYVNPTLDTFAESAKAWFSTTDVSRMLAEGSFTPKEV